MSFKDWLLGGGFVLVMAAVVITVIIVMAHESHAPAHSTRHQDVNLRYCYQNLGNGGC